jgi:hypothetical protein
MMLYATADKSAVTITKDGYIEFFIKDTGHTSSTTERASGVALRLYNGSSATKVDGYKDVNAYNGSQDYNAEYRVDAGNGWSCYKLPLTLFGTEGASFDRIRFLANAAFDGGEIMYLDGLRIVVASTSDEADDVSDGEDTILSSSAVATQEQDTASADIKNNELYIYKETV